jgi:type III pantothenate kinase
VIGVDTASSIQSGLIFGYAGLVDTLIQRIETEMGRSSFVIATGGLAQVIASEARTIQHIEPFLTLQGLELLYRRAHGPHSANWV